MRWKWNYWCTNGSTIMLASCFKKQMQLEFMFSSLSEKRNQSKLPSKSCVVIQIPPTKICKGKQEPGNGRAEILKAAVAPLAWGWQLRGSAFRLKSTSLSSSVPENSDYHTLQEGEERGAGWWQTGIFWKGWGEEESLIQPGMATPALQVKEGWIPVWLLDDNRGNIK